MIMLVVTLVVMAGVTVVGAAFGLEGGAQLYKNRSGPMQHVLDYMIRPDAKNSLSNFSRQMPISQMPSQAHKLVGIFVRDFHNKLRSGPNLQPSAIFKLQAVSVGHRDRLRKIEEDVFTLICRQANAAAMARFKIKRENACCLFLRPQPGAAMD
jgi:hypothetical protein